jgi:hypothetical protein
VGDIAHYRTVPKLKSERCGDDDDAAIDEDATRELERISDAVARVLGRQRAPRIEIAPCDSGTDESDDAKDAGKSDDSVALH